MNVKNAVSASYNSHGELACCEFRGNESQLGDYIADTFANGDEAVFLDGDDGTIDVCDSEGDWEIRVKLIEVA